ELSALLRVKEASVGEGHPDLVQFLKELALARSVLGDDVEAISLLECGLEISERAYGPSHPEVAHSLSLLAMPERAAAYRLLCRSMDNDFVTPLLCDHATLLQLLQRADEAEAVYRRAIDILDVPLADSFEDERADDATSSAPVPKWVSHDGAL